MSDVAFASGTTTWSAGDLSAGRDQCPESSRVEERVSGCSRSVTGPLEDQVRQAARGTSRPHPPYRSTVGILGSGPVRRFDPTEQAGDRGLGLPDCVPMVGRLARSPACSASFYSMAAANASLRFVQTKKHA